jgi:hypothetical protein
LQAAFSSGPKFSALAIGKLYLEIGDTTMTKLTVAAIGAVLVLVVGAGTSFAQVKRVEMKIDGYLCGN